MNIKQSCPRLREGGEHEDPVVYSHVLARACFFLLLGTTAQAAIIRPLDELKVIEISISSQDLTRIAVEDDRISHVFGSADAYVLEADEEQGQIFIRPTDNAYSSFEEDGSRPINLTLTTEKGHTQDLCLIPKNQPPEALILKVETKDAEELVKEKLTQNPISRDEVETLLQACHEGRIPVGYKLMPLNLLTLKSPHLLTRELRGERLKGLTYEIKNRSKIPLILSEIAFAENFPEKKQNIIAISMPIKTLKPGERSFIHVVEKF